MNADRHYAVASILFDYVKSPSLRHLRDPHSVHKVSREIVKALDGASSAWKKWKSQREEVAQAAAPCWIPVEDLQAFLNTLPGPLLTKTDVEQRLRAIWEEPHTNYPKDELKDGCAALYQSEKAEGTEMRAIIGALQEHIACEENRLSPLGADKLYDRFAAGEKGARLRTAEKMVLLCRKAWRVVHRLHPAEFANDVPNPWIGVTMQTRVKLTKHAVNREQVYAFAQGCIAHGEPECGAAAVICFEWLQRPENVIGGHIKWTGYRTGPKPTIRIEHHKTGAVIDHPLEERLPDGTIVKFYEDAEAVLAKLTRRGIPMILRDVGDGMAKPYSFSGMQKIVQRMRKDIGLPVEFTLDACRHGGMTELEEAELTEGQGRALSAHRTKESYAGYAKRTEARMLSATRKRHAHWLANQTATTIQNELDEPIQNAEPISAKTA